MVIKRVRYAVDSAPAQTSPSTTSPSTFLSSNGYEPLNLPTKKRLNFQQYPETDQYGKLNTHKHNQKLLCISVSVLLDMPLLISLEFEFSKVGIFVNQYKYK